MRAALALLSLVLLSCALSCATPAPPELPARASTASPATSVSTPAPRLSLVDAHERRIAEIALFSRDRGLSGRAALFELDRGVLVVLDVSGAAPGRYAAHLHEHGDCDDASRAGLHWNPDGSEHGLPPWLGRHLGDLGNLEVGENGRGRLEVLLPDANLEPGHLRSPVGRALLIKAGPDDGSQPFGGADEPIACGVVSDWNLDPGGLVGARYR